MRQFTLLSILFLFSGFTFAFQCDMSDFNEFYVNFKNEKQFADNRTIFPLRLTTWEYGIDSKGKDISSKIINYAANKKDVSLLSDFMKEDGLTEKTTMKNNSKIIITIFKQDTDFQLQYHFTCHKNSWFLYEIEDQSL